jgi:predicted nucleic acid-binding protein
VSSTVLLDTGPLVAFLNRRDRHHAWARRKLAEVTPPLLTCESVLSEACFLLRQDPKGPAAVLELVARGLIRVALDVNAEAGPLRRLVARYREVPMSLADACLVRLAEKTAGSSVLTFDRDFQIYRMHGRQVIPLHMPREITPASRAPRGR